MFMSTALWKITCVKINGPGLLLSATAHRPPSKPGGGREHPLGVLVSRYRTSQLASSALCCHSVNMASSIRHVYTSVACNRTANALDWGNNAIVCYAASQAVAIYDPKVGRLLTSRSCWYFFIYLAHVCQCRTGRTGPCMPVKIDGSRS